MVYSLYRLNKPTDITEEEFGKWLSGFIDAEGNFQVFMDRGYLRVMFRINLHIDDIEILYKIKKYLGVGTVRVKGNSCVFVISNSKDCSKVLIPFLTSQRSLIARRAA